MTPETQRWLGTARLSLFGLLVACGSPPAGMDATIGDPRDGGASDAADAANPRDAHVDAGRCLEVTSVEAFRLDVDDDTGMRIRARFSPEVEGEPWDLYVWFQRFGDSTFDGEVALGVEPNDNFPDCPHCVIALKGFDLTRGFFARSGTMELHGTPFDGRVSLTLRDVVLAEVTIGPSDDPIPSLRSTWVEDGGCLLLPTVTVEQAFPPSDWRCSPDLYGEGEGCDCDCGAWDPDCSACDPFADPSCDPTVVAPTRRCATGEVCSLDASCVASCETTPCRSGACAYWIDGQRICVQGAEWLDAAVVGEDCRQTGRLHYCDVLDGVARGVCAWWDSRLDGPAAPLRCWAACERDAECGVDETCVGLFTAPEADGPGYCQPRQPPDWTCAPSAFDDGVTCDCACGTWDPDCGDPYGAPMTSPRCGAGEVCVLSDENHPATPGECVPRPSNDACDSAEPLALDVDVSGTTRGAGPTYLASACFPFGREGFDVVYALSLTAGQRLRVDATPTDPRFDLALYLVGPGDAASCDGDPSCAATADAAGRGGAEALRFTSAASGTYHLVVDSYAPRSSAFVLRATLE